MKTKAALTLAVTGNLGSGKSAILKSFQKLGTAVFDCDEIARQITSGCRTSVLRKIASLLGSGVLDSKEQLDRQATAKVVFSNPLKRRKLENLLHPLILAELKRRLDVCRNPLRVIEVPLLFESGRTAGLFDAILVAWTRRPLVVRRLLRRGLSRQEIAARLDAQMPIEEKCCKADFILDNNLSFHETHRQVKTIHQACRNIIESRNWIPACAGMTE